MRAYEFLTERYLNLFLSDKHQRERYTQEVWDLLQNVYKTKGGLKGSGFKTPDDMVNKLPMWKLARKNGRIVAVAMYKDKNGRKLVASGSDGSPEGMAALEDMAPHEPMRAYSEKSKEALGFFLREVPNAQDWLIPFEKAQKISADKLISAKEARDKWPELSDEELDATNLSLNKYPFLIDYGYFRMLDGEWHFKVMLGTPGLTIDRT